MEPGRDADRRAPVRASVTFLPEPEPEQDPVPDHLGRRPRDGAVRPVRVADAGGHAGRTRRGSSRTTTASRSGSIAGTAYPLITADGAVGRPQSEWNNCAQKQRGLPPRRHRSPPPARRHGPVRHLGLAVLPVDRVGFRRHAAVRRSPTSGRLPQRPGLQRLDDRGVVRHRPAALHPVPADLAARSRSWRRQEIRRNAERGCHAVSFSENPQGLGYPSIHTSHWDPFFAACEETGTVINLHVGSSGRVTRVRRPTARRTSSSPSSP